MKDRHDFSSDEGVPTCAGSAGATACPKRVFGWCGRGPKQDTSWCPKFGWSNMFNAENMTNRQGSDNMKTSSIQYIQYQYPHIREKHQKAQLYPTPIFNSHSTHNVTRLCLQFWCWSYSCSCWLRCIRHRHRGCCRCRCWCAGGAGGAAGAGGAGGAGGAVSVGGGAGAGGTGWPEARKAPVCCTTTWAHLFYET